MNRILPLCAVLVFLLFVSGAQVAFAQDGADGIDLGGVDQAGGAGGDGVTTADTSGFQIEVDVAEDERSRRGFVGVSSLDPDVDLEYRFVGANRADTDINTANTGAAAATRPATAINVSDGIFVERSNPVRARLVRAFRAPTLAPAAVSSQFNRRLRTLPATRTASSSMRVVMSGGTAIIRGSAQNRQQLMAVARQLRFEPGVSRIVSQVSVNR